VEEMDVGDPMRSAEGGCGRRVFDICCVFVGKKTLSEIENKFEACYDPQEAKREMKNVVVAEEREKKRERERTEEKDGWYVAEKRGRTCQLDDAK